MQRLRSDDQRLLQPLWRSWDYRCLQLRLQLNLPHVVERSGIPTLGLRAKPGS